MLLMAAASAQRLPDPSAMTLVHQEEVGGCMAEALSYSRLFDEYLYIILWCLSTHLKFSPSTTMRAKVISHQAPEVAAPSPSGLDAVGGVGGVGGVGVPLGSAVGVPLGSAVGVPLGAVGVPLCCPRGHVFAGFDGNSSTCEEHPYTADITFFEEVGRDITFFEEVGRDITFFEEVGRAGTAFDKYFALFNHIDQARLLVQLAYASLSQPDVPAASPPAEVMYLEGFPNCSRGYFETNEGETFWLSTSGGRIN